VDRRLSIETILRSVEPMTPMPLCYLRLDNRSAMAKSDFLCVKTRCFFGFCHCAVVLQTQVPKLCTDLDLGLLYILILGTYSKFAQKKIPYRSAFAFHSSARALAAGLPCQGHVYKTTDESFRFHNKNFDGIRCKLDSTENPRSFEKYPTPP